MRALLGEDLWSLVAAAGSPCVEAKPLTTRPSPTLRRASFRLRLADGRVLKGRRAASVEDAARIADLWPELAHFPRLLAHRGEALLSEWIEGETPARPTADLVRRCGAFQARLHDRPLPPGLRRYAQRSAELPAVLRQALAALRGPLGDAEARRIEERAAEPPDAEPVCCHGDLCGENLVVGDDGGFHVVDNECLSVKPPAYDVARTWYRWPMPPPLWQAYLDGYRLVRPADGFEEHRAFWAALVLAEAAVFRLAAGTGGADEPLGRLRGLLEAGG